jgi:hypothetical protein
MGFRLEVITLYAEEGERKEERDNDREGEKEKREIWK